MDLELLKPHRDKKKYRLITLDNGLQALLVSDVENLMELKEDIAMSICEEGSDMDDSGTDGDEEENEELIDDGEVDVPESESMEEQKSKLAACSLCIAAGSYYDPPNAQGLAHFLEHMLFMGNEKYPEENGWDDFVQACGGYSNASTSYEYTRFHFECRNEFLGVILERFSQFFISPLLRKSSMAREREAVHSEFESSVIDDDTRLELLLGSLAPSGHPARIFSWGNKESLENQISDDDLIQALRQFWLTYYSADRMKLAVVSRLSLDTLEKYVRDNFSAVPTSKLPRLDLSSFRSVPWGKQFNSSVFVKPIHSYQEVCLSWVLPPLLDVYEADPLLYINFFIAHEAKGSILHYLKEKVWALSLVSGASNTGMDANSLYGMFSITLQLTQDGLDNLDKVIDVIFGYLALLRKSLPDRAFFDEFQAICLASFLNKSEEEPEEFVMDLSYAMHVNKPQHYLSAGEYIHEYRPEIISSVIQEFGVNNLNITVRNSALDTEIYDQEEYWCKTKYKIVEFGEDKKKAWANAEPSPFCSLPRSNPYLTKNFDIVSCDKETKYPEKILETPMMELWFRQDSKFQRPIAIFTIVMSSYCMSSLESAVEKDLLVKFLNMKLAGNHYDALVAGYSWGLESKHLDLYLTLSGYNENLPRLLTEVLADIKKEVTDIANPENELLFNAVKANLKRKYVNYWKDSDSFVRDLRLAGLDEYYWTSSEKLSALADITLPDLEMFCKEFFENFHAQFLIQGNLTRETALQVGTDFSIGFQPPSDPIPLCHVWKLERGKETYLRVDTVNLENNQGFIVNYYQYGKLETMAACMIDLLMYLMSEPLFDSLRTKQQLGYTVSCEATLTSGILGFVVFVSHQRKFTTDDVNDRIETFLEKFSKKLRNLPAGQFEKSKETLCALKSVDDHSLAEEVNRNFNEIVNKYYVFNRLELEVAAIKSLTLDQFCEFFDKLAVNKDTRRKLSIQVLPAPISAPDANGATKEDTALTFNCPDKDLFISSLEGLRQSREFYTPAGK